MNIKLSSKNLIRKYTWLNSKNKASLEESILQKTVIINTEEVLRILVEKVEDMITYYGITQKNKWSTYPAYSNKLNEDTHRYMTREDFSVEKIAKGKYRIGGSIINRSTKMCNCRLFLKRAICRHSLAYSNCYDLNWYGVSYSSRNEFVYKNKKGRKKGPGRYKKANKALQFESD